MVMKNVVELVPESKEDYMVMDLEEASFLSWLLAELKELMVSNIIIDMVMVDTHTLHED